MNIFSTQQWAKTRQGYYKDRIPKEKRCDISYIVGGIGITIKCGQYLHILGGIDLAIKGAALSFRFSTDWESWRKNLVIFIIFCYNLGWMGTMVKGAALSVTFSANWESWRRTFDIFDIFVMISIEREPHFRAPHYFFMLLAGWGSWWKNLSIFVMLLAEWESQPKLLQYLFMVWSQ